MLYNNSMHKEFYIAWYLNYGFGLLFGQKLMMSIDKSLQHFLISDMQEINTN